MISTRLARLLAVGVLSAAMAPLLASAAQADTLPFRDPNVVGKLGFCDKNNHAVASGRVTDVPFAWKTVSSVPAAKPYAVPLGKATLYAFSPIKNVNPGDWSPYRMTGSSTYSNKQHPMSEATIGDAPLEWQSTSFPPTWDGLVQMRLLLSAPNQQVLFTPYPAAVIKISGGTWTLVDGDTSPACSSGQAVSSEKVLIPAKLQPTAPPPGATTPSAAPSGSATLGSVSSDPSGSNTSNVEPGGGQSGANAAAPARTNSSPSIVPIALALVAITAVVAGGVGFWAARTRGAEPSGRH